MQIPSRLYSSNGVRLVVLHFCRQKASTNFGKCNLGTLVRPLASANCCKTQNDQDLRKATNSTFSLCHHPSSSSNWNQLRHVGTGTTDNNNNNNNDNSSLISNSNSAEMPMPSSKSAAEVEDVRQEVEDVQQGKKDSKKKYYSIPTLACTTLSAHAEGSEPEKLSLMFKAKNWKERTLKYLTIVKKNLATGQSSCFQRILVPENAYPFVRAMDELLKELATKEEGDIELPSTGSHLQMFSTSLRGTYYDFKLDLGWTNDRFGVNLGTIRTEAKPDHVEKTMWMDLDQFIWLRQEMGAMLAEYDGSEPVDEPPSVPGWLLSNGNKEDEGIGGRA